MRFVVAALAGLFLVGFVMSPRVWQSRDEPSSTNSFDALVLERVGGVDGKLSRETFLRMGGRASVFSRYDRDHDGSLDASEFARALEAEDPTLRQAGHRLPR